MNEIFHQESQFGQLFGHREILQRGVLHQIVGQIEWECLAEGDYRLAVQRIWGSTVCDGLNVTSLRTGIYDRVIMDRKVKRPGQSIARIVGISTHYPY